MAGERLDGLARALAEPMPRRGAVRAIVTSLAALAVPGLAPNLTSAAAAPTKRGGSAAVKCPDGSECTDGVCCPMPSPLSGQFNCCKTTEHCCCGNACCDPEGQICVCPGQRGVGGRCVDKVCGPNLTEPISEAVYWVNAQFKAWSGAERAVLCSHLYSMGPIAWDIAEIDPVNRRRFIRQFGLECTLCGDAVGIGSECHHAGSVNYVVFGVMMRLCHDNFRGGPFANWFDQEAMNLLIVAHKTSLTSGEEAGNLDGSIDWANAGYNGWPFKGRAPLGDRRKCKGPCPKYYSGPGFTVRWSYKRIRRP